MHPRALARRAQHYNGCMTLPFIQEHKAAIIGILVLIILGTLFVALRGEEDTWLCVDGQWMAHGQPSAPKPASGCGAGAVADFSETGHFTRDNPGLKPGVWYLVYEKPGAPALTAELRFTSASSCKYGPTEGSCPDVLLPSSAMTHVTGIKNTDGSVTVLTAVSP